MKSIVVRWQAGRDLDHAIDQIQRHSDEYISRTRAVEILRALPIPNRLHGAAINEDGDAI